MSLSEGLFRVIESRDDEIKALKAKVAILEGGPIQQRMMDEDLMARYESHIERLDGEIALLKEQLHVQSDYIERQRIANEELRRINDDLYLQLRKLKSGGFW